MKRNIENSPGCASQSPIFGGRLRRSSEALGEQTSLGFENEGTELPCLIESTILIKNKAGFRNVALSFSAVCGLPSVLSGQEHDQGTKLPSVMESTILIKNKAGFRNVALSFSAACGLPIALSGKNMVNAHTKMKEQSCHV